MLKSPIPGSEELLQKVKQRLGPNRKPLLIAIDGPDGVGKSSLASWLAWQLGTPTVHLDLYVIKGSKPLKWMGEELARIIGARINNRQPIIVEGVLLLDALDQIGRSPDFLAFVRGEGGRWFSEYSCAYHLHHKPTELADFCLDGFCEG